MNEYLALKWFWFTGRRERHGHLVVGRLRPGRGYAVLSADHGYKTGPNPLKKRGAEYALAVIKALDIDCRYPQPASAGLHNERAVAGCPKLKAWLMNWWWKL